MTEIAPNNLLTPEVTAKQAEEYFLHIRQPDDSELQHFSEARRKVDDLLSPYDQGLIGSARYYLLHDELIDQVMKELVPLPEAKWWERLFQVESKHTREVKWLQFHAPESTYVSWGVLMGFDPNLKENPVIANPTYFVKMDVSLLPRLKSEWICDDSFLHPSYYVYNGNTREIRYKTAYLNPGIYSKVILRTTNEGLINKVEVQERDELADATINQTVTIGRGPNREVLTGLTSSHTYEILEQMLAPLPFDRLNMNT